MKNNINQKGFSMIELMIIVTIMSVLAVTATTHVGRIIDDKEDEVQELNKKSMNKAIRKYRETRGYFPTNINDLVDAKIIKEIPKNFYDPYNQRLWKLVLKGGSEKMSDQSGYQEIVKVDDGRGSSDAFYITAGEAKTIVIGELIKFYAASVPKEYKELTWSGDGIELTKKKDKITEFYQNIVGEYEVNLEVISVDNKKAHDSFKINVIEFDSELKRYPFDVKYGFLSGEILITNKKEISIKGECNPKTDKVYVVINEEKKEAEVLENSWNYSFTDLKDGEYTVELYATKVDDKDPNIEYEDKNPENKLKFNFIVDNDAPILEFRYFVENPITKKIIVWLNIANELVTNSDSVELKMDQPGSYKVNDKMEYKVDAEITKLEEKCFFYEIPFSTTNEILTNEFIDGEYKFDLENLKTKDMAGNKLTIINKKIDVKTIQMDNLIISYDGPSDLERTEEVFGLTNCVILENERIIWNK